MILIAQPSVQSLYIQMMFNDAVLASGTGFIVERGHDAFLVTNRHNVTGRDQETGRPLHSKLAVPNRVRIWHNAQHGLGSWVSVVESILDEADQPLWFEHPKFQGRADIVALRLTNRTQVTLYPYPLDGGAPISAGPAEPVSVIGFPFGKTAAGYFAIWATGFIASEINIDIDRLPIFYIDCRSRQGQSGSPVVAYRNGGSITMEDGSTGIFNGPVSRLLGVYSGRINAESDIGIVWKMSAVIDLINGIP